MDGSAIFQVADHGDVQVLKRALRLLNGEQIQQGLRRVLVGTVTGVQHRNAAGKLGRQTRRALLRVAHHNRVDVGTDNRNGIRRSRLLPSDVLLLSEAHHARARAVHGGLKGEAGAGRGFKEAARNHLVLQQLRLRIGLQFCRGFQNQFQLFAAEVVYGNDVF